MRYQMTFIFCLILLLSACAEEQHGVAPVEQRVESFLVYPELALELPQTPTTVRLDSLALGVDAVLLEPLESQEGIVSSADGMMLHFDLGEIESAQLGELRLKHEGWYLVTLAIAPQGELPTGLERDADPLSVRLDGVFFTVPDPDDDDPVGWPEPVPLRPIPAGSNAGDWGVVERADILKTEFSYQSARTAYIRIGKVYLSQETPSLLIQVGLEAWLDAALNPALEDYVDGEAPEGFDLSASMESNGMGLEKIFMVSKAIAR